jgi:RHH-type proline utilization regulon transcriptional repressor/proline dehydrogenase/delta 1-pyrroline-5-carboxylate dehydrogenase
MLDNNPCLWSPGIRIGVQPGNWYHRHECFGPVLGVMRVDCFEQAIRIQNSSPFGLTGGLHSLDPAEIATWRERVEVGNAYVNRSTTGAIVRRQPFGGWKDSCVGPGAKAGGKNYVAALCHWSNHGLPTKLSEPDRNLRHVLSCLQQLKLGDNTLQECRAAAGSYSYWWQHEFSVVHDPSQIHGESNHFRYRPRPWHIVRIGYQTPNPVPQVALVLMACLITNTSLQVSSEQAMAPMNEFLQVLAPMKFSLEIESEAELASRLNRLAGGTVRLLSPVDRQVLSPERIGNIPIFDSPPLLNGRIELLSYLREQSVSEIVHRYGNII